MKNELKFDIIPTENRDSFLCKSYLNNDKVCECRITVSNRIWSITSWYTVKEFMHRGFGSQTLSALLKGVNVECGLPDKVEYIWNGANQYVFDWLCEHFGAVSKCPIAVQKYDSSDDWDSHIYTLNRDKFVNYFGLV